jgi:hypothetical protein
MRPAPLLAGLVIGLVAFLPARLALPAPPLAARAVAGSLWRAELADAQAGGLPLGTLGLSAQPLALLKGRLQWLLSGSLSGSVWRSAAAQGADGLSGRINGAALPGLAIRSIDLASVSLALDGAGRCQSAGGQINAALVSPVAGQAMLSGSPACDGAALIVPLASGDGRLRLDLAIRPGRWQARARIAGASPAEQLALTAAGFRPDGASLGLVQEGSW